MSSTYRRSVSGTPGAFFADEEEAPAESSAVAEHGPTESVVRRHRGPRFLGRLRPRLAVHPARTWEERSQVTETEVARSRATERRQPLGSLKVIGAVLLMVSTLVMVLAKPLSDLARSGVRLLQGEGALMAGVLAAIAAFLIAAVGAFLVKRSTSEIAPAVRVAAAVAITVGALTALLLVVLLASSLVL